MSDQPQYSIMRDVILFAGLGVLVAIIFLSQGTVYSLRMMVEAGCYAIIALGLTIQWGYAGLFNVGIMGFIAAGAASSMLISFPQNPEFWNSAGPSLVGMFLVKLVACGVAVWVASKSNRWGMGPKLRTLLIAVAIAMSYLVLSSHMDTMAREIEQASGWMGGLGLPVMVGWLVAGIFAGVIALLTTGQLGPLIPLASVFLAFFWLYNVVDAARRAVMVNEALAGRSSIELPEDYAAPGLRGSILGGTILVLAGLVLLSHNLLGLSLEWLEDWWPLAIVLFGAFLIYKAMSEKAADSAGLDEE